MHITSELQNFSSRCKTFNLLPWVLFPNADVSHFLSVLLGCDWYDCSFTRKHLLLCFTKTPAWPAWPFLIYLVLLSVCSSSLLTFSSGFLLYNCSPARRRSFHFVSIGGQNGLMDGACLYVYPYLALCVWIIHTRGLVCALEGGVVSPDPWHYFPNLECTK